LNKGCENVVIASYGSSRRSRSEERCMDTIRNIHCLGVPCEEWWRGVYQIVLVNILNISANRSSFRQNAPIVAPSCNMVGVAARLGRLRAFRNPSQAAELSAMFWSCARCGCDGGAYCTPTPRRSTSGQRLAPHALHTTHAASAGCAQRLRASGDPLNFSWKLRVSDSRI
jgi:hypothetical protein